VIGEEKIAIEIYFILGDHTVDKTEWFNFLAYNCLDFMTSTSVTPGFNLGLVPDQV
jgi:hypothetical protein